MTLTSRFLAIFFIFTISTFVGVPLNAHAQDRLRIVTFNAHCLAAPGTNDSRIPRFRWGFARIEHLESVASLIETLDPDITNLIEVTSAAAINNLVRILHEKGLDDYQGYHVESADRFTGFDVAMISRLKPEVVEGKQIRCITSKKGDAKWRETYSYKDEDGQSYTRDTSVIRNALYYFSFRGYKLGFLGLHFKSDPGDPYSNARRTAECLITQRIIRKEIVERGYVPVVLGDLNDYDPDVPDADDTRSTQTNVLRDLKNYDPSTKQAELVNVAERISRIEDRHTSHWDRNENGVADSQDVFTMIDYILLPRQMMPMVQRAFVCRCTDLRTSDHFAVVVDLKIPE